MKIKPEFKERLVAALRSGKYSQIQDMLHNDTGFCCLGVACDLYDPNGWVKNEIHEGYTFIDHEGHKSPLGLPLGVESSIFEEDEKDVREQFTPNQELEAKKLVSESLGHDAYEYEFYGLAGLNDKGLTFNQIAYFIEEHC